MGRKGQMPKKSMPTKSAGGEGGTGNSITNPTESLLVPLNSRTNVGCSPVDAVGSYQLVQKSARQPIINRPLCLNTLFVLNKEEEVTLSLPQDQKVSVRTTGISQLTIKRTTHHAWGSRLEIDIRPMQGEADVEINKELFPIPPGFAGQIWLEGRQAFWGLRR